MQKTFLYAFYKYKITKQGKTKRIFLWESETVMFRILNIKGTVLDKYQLEKYMENLASDNNITSSSDKTTYPIPRMMENFELITNVYNILNSHLKLGINIHPAGEWILDNYYIIEETVKVIQENLSMNKYINFVGIDNGQYKGLARIYFLAAQMCAYTDNNINKENIIYMLQAYQRKKSLSMDEIWNIGIFIQISIIERIAEICEKIYSSQMQKYKVENIVERLVEQKSRDQQIYTNKGYSSSKLGYREMKYPFVEYMSYKLKKSGKKAYKYLEALEEQTQKMGTSVSDIIKKEHFDIALKKVLMANSITSIKEINRINFLEIFEKINGVEEILKNDPSGVYTKMDYKTKEYYRNVIKEISKKSKISEIYIAQKLIELASKEVDKKDKRAHIGFYLISDGKQEFYNYLGISKKILSTQSKIRLYIFGIYLISSIFSILIGFKLYERTNIFYAILVPLVSFIPISEIIIQIIQYILSKIVKPKLLPKIDMLSGVDKENSTMVVIPTIINNEDKIKHLVSKLEVYYLANKSNNLYFTILGDCTSSQNEENEEDKKIIRLGLEEIQKLNQKYSTNDLPIFHFLYRKRVWNDKEEAFLGWERKRGLLNQFNKYLLNNDMSDFIVNTIQDYKQDNEINIKYVITLDADTELILNSAFELIGTMAHILNKPELNQDKTLVEKGHGIIQPKVGINLDVSKKTLFTKIYAGSGGTDLYTNAISDIYQDNFGEGIFTGKGIYDVKVFDKVMGDIIPENTVLSHDLLEGNYLRCGLASDILLMDGYPYKYNSFMTRLQRWIRGDWQISSWIKNTVKDKDGRKIRNPLKLLSRYKIFDNLRRSLIEISAIILFFLSILIKGIYDIPVSYLIIIAILSIIMPSIMEILDVIVFKKDGRATKKTFSPVISGIKGSFIRLALTLSFWIDKAYVSANAIIKTIYRKCISKKHLLEWTTSEEAEKISKNTVSSYLGSMWFSVVLAIILATYSDILGNLGIIILTNILGICWILSPIISRMISLEKEKTQKLSLLDESEKEYILNIAKDTWKFFKDTIVAENNFLPPDNYQESRKIKLVDRTSSTNIGLGLLAVVSSYDLKFESLETVIDTLNNMICTIEKLGKWNGHLYNWYNIKTLEPLNPRYISTVDSGNFVGYLYVLKQFFIGILKDEEKQKELDPDNIEKIKMNIELVDKWINETNFRVLYDESKRIFSIGFNIEENKLTDSYYDLLASEARQASIVAISKKDIPAKHWNNLSRTLTTLNKYKGLISWSGTSFEYLMPNINIKRYEGSLLDESCKFMIMSQIEYTKKLGIPWGISESAFNLKDLNSNYQYKSFGIPWLGLKRGLADEAVVSGYGSVLAITDCPKEVIDNIKRLDNEGMIGKYGLYEAIDYTDNRLKYGEKSAVVKTFMAHHQGLILLSIDNLFNNNILQKRFSDNPEIKSIEILLQERLPENIITTKEKKEKTEKLKYKDYESYTEKTYNKINEDFIKSNVIGNEDYTVVTDQRGIGFSKIRDIYINRYKETDETNKGINFFIKNIKTEKIWSTNYLSYTAKPEKYSVSFSPDATKISRVDGNIETNMKVIVAPESPTEIRNLEIRNNGLEEEVLEITSYFEPIISSKEADISHRAFNNLFLRYDFDEHTNSLIIERRQRDCTKNNIFLGVNLYTENETIGELEYEIDNEKFLGRENLEIPIMVRNSKTLSKELGLITDPCTAIKRTFKIKPQEKIELSLILSIGEARDVVIKNIENYLNNENIKKSIELTKAKAIEEARYLDIKGIEIENIQNIMSLLINTNYARKMYITKFENRSYSQEDLWKFGISGDFPILMIKIKDVNDAYVIQDILKAYEYLKIRNVNIEVVMLNMEKYSYDQYLGEAIQNEILNRHLEYMKNIKGGIFVLNEYEISKEDKELLNFRADLILDAHLGDIKYQLEQIEEEYKAKKKNIGDDNILINKFDEEVKQSNNLDKIDNLDNLKYYNEYGAFSKDGREYIMRVNSNHKLPTTWSHILANKNFGTVITEGMGGYTWNKNSRLNRLTAWNNNPSLDVPSEIIYLKNMENGKTWSLGSRPKPDNNDYYIIYGLGYAKYIHTSQDIVQELEVFVPKEDSIKVNIISLKNTTSNKKKLKLYYYIKPVLGEDELKSNSNIIVKKENEIVYAQNLYTIDFKNMFAYISSSEKISSFTGNKNSFIGNSGVQNPIGITKVSLDNENGLGMDSCIAFEVNIELNPYEKRELSICLGEEASKLDMKNIAYKYSNISNCKQELSNVKKNWYEFVNRLQVKTPIESINILLNGWIVYQTIVSRLMGRTGYYQSGGAFGFRDQLQDTLGIGMIDKDIMKKQIIKHSRHQFIEGDVEHWWHDETKKGIRTRFSDDLLWLVYIVNEYIKISDDYEILKIKTPYLKGNLLEPNVMEKYELYESSEIEGSIYEHCIKAIEKSLDFGEHGLPKIGSGDWNDGFSNLGCKGKGESVWLGFFIYKILSDFIQILNKLKEENIGDDIDSKGKIEDKICRYGEIVRNLKKALNKNGWDGRWYKRAFADNGDILGSIENEECRIDSIAQSWSVISNAGDNDKKYISMESLENHLVDKENGIIKLLDPPFDKGKLEPGYIKAYLPGVRENGGQYTHAAIWAVIAETMLGFGDKAVELFNMINPIEHSRTRETVQKYKVEPYVIAADVYGVGNLQGRGGWTWYTGSSSWMYKAGVYHILGLKIEEGYLKIEPCISKSWKEYSMKYKYEDTIYDIKVKNPNEKNTGVSEFYYNGNKVADKRIKLVNNKSMNKIEIII